MKRVKPITYDTVRRIALTFPDVEESTSYGTPALKVKGKLIVRLRDEIDSIVVKMPFDRREALMEAEPQTYYITEHYLRYEWVLVRLSEVRADALRELLEIAYREALPVKRVRR